MLELWIDGSRCDIDAIPLIPFGYDIDNLTKVDANRAGRSLEVELPATPCNNALFGSSQDLYATSRFNAEHHIATIKRDGVAIFEGMVYLRETAIQEEVVKGYKICIKEGGAGWIEQVAKNRLRELDIPYSGSLDLATITDSWDGEQAVRFLPIYRRGHLPRYSSSSALPVERVLLTDDYHPFISVAEMVKAMFAKTGYTLRSNFLDSEFGRSLYMSGEYTRSDASLAKSRCDFFARRSAPTTAKADFAGRVYASAAFATSSVGAIVDTANPNAYDSDGVQMSETFNTLNAFSIDSYGNACFTPKYAVKAGFMLHIEYTTDYKILSRNELLGFNVVEGMDGVRVDFPLTNTCTDYRNSATKSMQYRALVFNHIEGREYRLSAYGTDDAVYNLSTWSSRSQLVTTPSQDFRSLQLFYRSDNSVWQVYTGDWALYGGYIEEEGRVDVALDFRIPPQSVSAGGKFTLDKVWFGGAEQGMAITIGNGTTLQPYFTVVPGYGSNLTFADIAPRHLNQIELLTAIGEMFNLAFYTDELHKEVHIEPLEELYHASPIIDWSNRVDLSQVIALSDAGIERAQNRAFYYLDSDFATHSFNLENDTVFGRWEHRNPLYGTKDSTKLVGNQLFTTTLNISDVVNSAPSASLMQVGDTESFDSALDEPFTPHIVCYKGLKELPEGECWVTHDRLDHYPYATFSDGESVNLCFEDRDGLQGLNRYYTAHLARLSEGQRLTLDLHLTTAEIASLFTADGTKPSLRTRFRFNIKGEHSLFRLAKVDSWDTERGTVRCTFERELETI